MERDGLSKTKDVIEVLCTIGTFVLFAWFILKNSNVDVEAMVKRAHREQAIQEEIRLFGRPLEEGE